MKFAWNFIRPFFDRVRRSPYYLFVETVGLIAVAFTWRIGAIQMFGWLFVLFAMVAAAVLYSWVEYFYNKYQIKQPESKFGELVRELDKATIYLEDILHDETKYDSERTRDLLVLMTEIRAFEIKFPPFKMESAAHLRVWSSFLNGIYSCAKHNDLEGARNYLEKFKQGKIDRRASEKIGLYKPTDKEND